MSDSEKKQLLLVEDREVQADIITKKLEECTDYDVVQMRNAKEAIEYLQNDVSPAVKLILTDMHMGGEGENGPDLLLYNVENDCIPMAGMSGSVSREQVEDLARTGSIPIFHKDLFFDGECDDVGRRVVKVEDSFSLEDCTETTKQKIEDLRKEIFEIPVLNVAVEHLIDLMRDVLQENPSFKNVSALQNLLPDRVIGRDQMETITHIHDWKNDLPTVCDILEGIDTDESRAAISVARQVQRGLSKVLYAAEKEKVKHTQIVEWATEHIWNKEDILDIKYWGDVEKMALGSAESQAMVLSLLSIFDEIKDESVSMTVSPGGLHIDGLRIEKSLEKALQGICQKVNINFYANEDSIHFNFDKDSYENVEKTERTLDRLKEKKLLFVDHEGALQGRVNENVLEKYRKVCGHENVRMIDKEEFESAFVDAADASEPLGWKPDIILHHGQFDCDHKRGGMKDSSQLKYMKECDDSVTFVLYGGGDSMEYYKLPLVDFYTMSGVTDPEGRIFATPGTPSDPLELAELLPGDIEIFFKDKHVFLIEDRQKRVSESMVQNYKKVCKNVDVLSAFEAESLIEEALRDRKSISDSSAVIMWHSLPRTDNPSLVEKYLGSQKEDMFILFGGGDSLGGCLLNDLELEHWGIAKSHYLYYANGTPDTPHDLELLFENHNLFQDSTEEIAGEEISEDREETNIEKFFKDKTVFLMDDSTAPRISNQMVKNYEKICQKVVAFPDIETLIEDACKKGQSISKGDCVILYHGMPWDNYSHFIYEYLASHEDDMLITFGGSDNVFPSMKRNAVSDYKCSSHQILRVSSGTPDDPSSLEKTLLHAGAFEEEQEEEEQQEADVESLLKDKNVVFIDETGQRLSDRLFDSYKDVCASAENLLDREELYEYLGEAVEKGEKWKENLLILTHNELPSQMEIGPYLQKHDDVELIIFGGASFALSETQRFLLEDLRNIFDVDFKDRFHAFKGTPEVEDTKNLLKKS